MFGHSTYHITINKKSDERVIRNYLLLQEMHTTERIWWFCQLKNNKADIWKFQRFYYCYMKIIVTAQGKPRDGETKSCQDGRRKLDFRQSRILSKPSTRSKTRLFNNCTLLSQHIITNSKYICIASPVSTLCRWHINYNLNSLSVSLFILSE